MYINGIITNAAASQLLNDNLADMTLGADTASFGTLESLFSGSVMLFCLVCLVISVSSALHKG